MSLPILIVAEDALASNFHPLTETRPVFDLRAGVLSVRERLRLRFRDRQVYSLVRPELAAHVYASTGLPGTWAQVPAADDALLVNGRVLADEAWSARAAELKPGEALASADGVSAARLDGAALEACRETRQTWPLEVLAGLEAHEAEAEWVRHSWDFIAKNPGWLVRDGEYLGTGTAPGTLAEGVHVKHPERVRIGRGVRIEPCCYLDASGGPILIEDGVLVQSHTRIEGPAWIGPRTQLLGGRIGEGTSLGPECRIAGEIEETVVQGYSNKRHHGFVGHSYIGEWVNLGALTTTSDLKNNYGPVRMWEAGAMADTGLMKLGSVLGDHVKTAIGTLLGTGTVVGVMSNVFTVSPPKHIGNFRWVGDAREEPHRWDKAGPLLRTVLDRRGLEASREYMELFQRLAV